jgi:transcriptional regulator with XRE-family HTH domain
MSPSAQSAFSEKLKQRIAALGLTQTDVAIKAGIDRIELNRMVNGKREPKPHEVAMLARVLKIDPEELAADVNQDEVKVFSVLAERVITADDRLTERERELEAVVQARTAAEARWTTEREELIEETLLAKQDAAARIAQVEGDAARREAQLTLAVRQHAEAVAQRDAEIVRLHGVIAANGQTIAELRQHLAGEGGRALFAGVIGAFAGAILSKSGD